MGLIILGLAFVLAVQSINLLIQSKNISKTESYAGIGFVCFGRSSIFIINAATALLCLGMPLSYFIIFGDVAQPLVNAVPYVNETFINRRDVL